MAACCASTAREWRSGAETPSARGGTRSRKSPCSCRCLSSAQRRHDARRVVGAERIAAEKIAGHGPGPCARAATGVAEVAAAAAPFEVIGVAEGHEKVASSIDVAEGTVAEVAGGLRQELARK